MPLLWVLFAVPVNQNLSKAEFLRLIAAGFGDDSEASDALEGRGYGAGKQNALKSSGIFERCGIVSLLINFKKHLAEMAQNGYALF